MLTARQERRQRYRAVDPERYRELRKASVRRHRRREREVVFGHYGRACACCGATERLTIDHLYGDGADHRREMGNRGGYRTYHWLIINGLPPGFQTLCEPCNFSKDRGAACVLDHINSETGATMQTPAGLSAA